MQAGSKKAKQKAKNAERLVCKQASAAGDVSEEGACSANVFLVTRSCPRRTADDQPTASEMLSEQQVEVSTGAE